MRQLSIKRKRKVSGRINMFTSSVSKLSSRFRLAQRMDLKLRSFQTERKNFRRFRKKEKATTKSLTTIKNVQNYISILIRLGERMRNAERNTIK